MHPMFFCIKRAHLRIVRLTQPLMKDAGLTPARFDMLRSISFYPGGVRQRTIRFLLGVSAATVSRMLKALELLGLVRRRRDETDRRHVIVTLTPVGEGDLDIACYDALDSGVCDAMAAQGVRGDKSAESDDPETEGMLTAVETLLLRMRKIYRDASPFLHPWRGAPFVVFDVPRCVDGRMMLGGLDDLADLGAVS